MAKARLQKRIVYASLLEPSRMRLSEFVRGEMKRRWRAIELAQAVLAGADPR